MYSGSAKLGVLSLILDSPCWVSPKATDNFSFTSQVANPDKVNSGISLGIPPELERNYHIQITPG